MRKLFTLFTFLLMVLSVAVMAQTATIKGKVLDNTGIPLPGVTVKASGGSASTQTDATGNYSIAAAPNATLTFTYIGFNSQTITVGNESTIDVRLTPSANNLNDVVVVGYGTRQKKDVTGSVSSFKATQIENENPNSLQDILRGNIPGLNVGLNTSAKGGGSLLVRGKTTLTANTSPLIVLDGVIYLGQLADINPNDIETVDVLKDASALAVYGAKAATGVIAVTTKKGKTGAPVITLNTNFGTAQLSKNQKVYDPEGFLAWRSDVQRIGNTNNNYNFYSDPRNLPADYPLTTWLNGATGDPVDIWLSRLGLFPNERANYMAGKTIDWAKEVFRTGYRQDHTVSMSGRKDEVSYYMSMAYTKNQNLIQGGDYSNVRGRVNLEGQASKFLTLGINAQYAVRDESAIEADWTQIVNNSPYGDMYNANGTLRRIPTDDSGLNARNPFLNNAYNGRMNIQNTLFANLFARVKLPFGISYQVNFTPGFDSYRTFNNSSSQNPNNTVPGGTATRQMENRYNYLVDNLLKWNRTFNNIHNFDVTLLANVEKYQTWWTEAYNEGFSPNDDLGYHNLPAGIKPSVNSEDKVYTADALLARLSYTLMGKYLLTASVRRDGYSVFGQKHPRATFPAVAVGWILTDESFMKSQHWLNYGKIRVSYGVNGNRDIRNPDNDTVDPYISLATLGTGKYPIINSSGVATAGATVSVRNLQNSELKWEQTASLNLGFDFALLNNRLNGSIDVYNKKTTNLLVNRTLTDVMGFSTGVISNIGEVNNKGFEFSLSSKNITNRNFTWSSTVNLFLNRNKIVHLYGETDIRDAAGNVTGRAEVDDIAKSWFIGKDIDVIWDYKVLGVWQENELTEAAKFKNAGIRAGDFKLQDVNGDYVYNDSDKQFLGYRSPRFTWSLRNDFNIYKNFDFSFLLVSNVGQLSEYNQAKNNAGSVGFARTTSYVQPYWTPQNPTNDYARLNSGFSGTSFNVYRKNTFIRLNTVSLGYTLPTNIANRLKMQSAKVFFNISNAAVYAPNWDYWDPQNGGPTPRYMGIGLNASF